MRPNTTVMHSSRTLHCRQRKMSEGLTRSFSEASLPREKFTKIHQLPEEEQIEGKFEQFWHRKLRQMTMKLPGNNGSFHIVNLNHFQNRTIFLFYAGAGRRGRNPSVAPTDPLLSESRGDPAPLLNG